MLADPLVPAADGDELMKPRWECGGDCARALFLGVTGVRLPGVRDIGEANGELARECGVRAKIGDCEAAESAYAGECRRGVPSTRGDRRKGDPMGPRSPGVDGDGGISANETGDASPR